MANEVRPLEQKLTAGFDDLSYEYDSRVEASAEEITSNGDKMVWVSTTLTVLMIVLGTVVAILTARHISRPLQSVTDRMKQMAEGELSEEPLKTHSSKEIGELITATNETNSSMRNLVNHISEVSEKVNKQSEALTQSAVEVKASSEQIATTMQELASGSETEANKTSELSSTMSTFTTNVQEANKHGSEIKDYADHVFEVIGEGTQLMVTSKT